ncbi:hypothetical protein RDI58_015458 [Solanum bulbocastanum]|uniref:Uncharacterized protein n=1 Tax=Solanum bulbocastanum TaxID=147425 RepID=A0AAN8TED1_SOLBU
MQLSIFPSGVNRIPNCAIGILNLFNICLLSLIVSTPTIRMRRLKRSILPFHGENRTRRSWGWTSDGAGSRDSSWGNEDRCEKGKWRQCGRTIECGYMEVQVACFDYAGAGHDGICGQRAYSDGAQG